MLIENWFVVLCSGMPLHRDDLGKEYVRKLLPMYRASTALFPSIYFGNINASSEGPNRAMVNRTIIHWLAIANASNPQSPPPVIPFTMWNYDNSGGAPLNDHDMVSELLFPYDVGAQGLIAWGSAPRPGSEQANRFWNLTRNRNGPAIHQLMASANACSKQHCGGPARGRCVPGSNGTRCQCYVDGARPGCGA
jgi:hypothetical protein